MEYVGNRIAQRQPAADTFALLASELDGVERVERIECLNQPAVYAFRAHRSQCEPVVVVWDRRDTFDGESEPPVDVRLAWSGSTAKALDAFGTSVSADVVEGHVRLAVSDTPLFVTAR
jgi:hypothetical protein